MSHIKPCGVTVCRLRAISLGVDGLAAMSRVRKRVIHKNQVDGKYWDLTRSARCSYEVREATKSGV